MKNIYLVLAVVVMGFAVTSQAHAHVRFGFGVHVGFPVPPAPAYYPEVVGIAPYPGAVWMRGHWLWRPYARRYAWIGGYWNSPHPRYGYWHPGFGYRGREVARGGWDGHGRGHADGRNRPEGNRGRR